MSTILKNQGTKIAENKIEGSKLSIE